MPWKIFADGEILDATEVNTYFMNQAVLRFSTIADRDATITTLIQGMFAYITDTSTIYIYDGTNWVEQLATITDGAVTEIKLASSAVTNTKIGSGAVTETKIGSSAVTEAKIGSSAVTEAKIATGAVTETKIGSSAVTSAKIATSVAGNGLAGGGGAALSVNVDDSTIEINSDALRLKDSGITSAKLGSGLSLTDPTLTGTTKIEEIFESATIVAAQPVASNGATLTLTITNGAVYYYTTATSHNIALDIVTTGLVAGQAATILLMVTSGATTGKLSSITVNGASNTPKWFGGNSFPNGSGGSAVDAYTVTVFRSSTGYTVFASQSKFA